MSKCNQMKKILICVGTRPNLIKITRFKECLVKEGLNYVLLHTGQHYDYEMNGVFFEELGLGKPDIFLNVKGTSQIDTIAQIAQKAEGVFEKEKPDMVLVPGDVNSSLACAISASRMGIPLGHIESGLRSFDRAMPEEINRRLIDELSDIFFVTEESGIKNLQKEGKANKDTFLVGNTMIDTLVKFRDQITRRIALQESNKAISKYGLVTFHRPSNVDSPDNLTYIAELLQSICDHIPVVFPVHPRTKKQLESNNLWEVLEKQENLLLTGPKGYFDFLNLVSNASFVLTDSGGIQEETTYLQVPCLTLRNNTERPITCEIGTNTLMELDKENILTTIHIILSGQYKTGQIPPYWDGFATERIVKAIKNFLL